MTNEFELFPPQKFFEEFVLRAFQEHLRSPLDRYHIKNAVHYANDLAERMFHWFNSNPSKAPGKFAKPSEYRAFLSQQCCSDFQLVWDVDDGQKHAELGRANRLVTSASQTGIRRVGGPTGKSGFDELTCNGDADAFIVRLDDGTERPLSDVLQNVVEMWTRILRSL